MKLFVYVKYNDCIVVFAHNKYEALGRIICEKDENGEQKYYPSENEIVEVPIPNNTQFVDSKIYSINDIKNKENEQ